MGEIKWTKTYDLKVNHCHFKVFVSEHEEGNGFHASCLWYEKGRVLRAPNQLGMLKFQLEQKYAATEKEALDQIQIWAQEKFGELVNLFPAQANPQN
jgi:hypothetical protein